MSQPKNQPVFPDSDSFWMPSQASSMAGEIDWLYFVMYWVCTAAAIGVFGSMIYFCLKYRATSRKANERATSRVDHDTKLEIVWSVIPLFIVMAFFYWGFKGYTKLRIPPKDSMEVHVQGQKWSWTFTHKNGCVDNVLHVPKDKNVRLILSSTDVLHSVWIPNFRVKMDAVPGRYTDLWFNATEAGTFPLECTEYCGDNHSDMITNVVVEDEAAYNAYLEKCTQLPDNPLEAGKLVFEKQGCKACHSTDGTKLVGPSLKGLFGKDEKLADGSSIKVDENYLRESVTKPQAKIVAGFAPSMPTYQGKLKDNELTALIEYIKSLK